jgi:hypothetical protein
LAWEGCIRKWMGWWAKSWLYRWLCVGYFICSLRTYLLFSWYEYEILYSTWLPTSYLFLPFL